jgi:arginine/lysine/histidine transporter system substrate-binding protein
MNTRTIIILISFVAFSLGLWSFSRKKESAPFAESDTLIVGTNVEFPPFSFIIDDQVVGFDIDVAKEVAKRLNKKIDIQTMKFEALIPEIQLGNIHMIAAGITPTQERAKRVFFTTPHITHDPLVIVQPRDAEPITSALGLKGKTIIVNQGYTSDRFATGLGSVEVVRISSNLVSNGILALKSGSGDVYITAQSALQPYLNKVDDQSIQIHTLENTHDEYALAISKKYPTLFYEVQTIIDAMRKDGTLDALKKQWDV